MPINMHQHIVVVKKNDPVFNRFFSTATYAAIPSFVTLLWKAV